MMGGYFQRVTAGQKFQPSARQWNAILEAAEAYRRSQRIGGGPISKSIESSTEIQVENVSGQDVGQFAILRPFSPAINPDDSEAGFRQFRTATCDAPQADQPFVITQEPIADGKLGWATVLGITPCVVNLTDISHRYADSTTSIEGLTSAKRGLARILWIESDFSALGLQWAFVLLGTGAGDVIEIVEPAGGSGSGAGCLQDYVIDDIDPDNCTATPGEHIYFIDANDL